MKFLPRHRLYFGISVVIFSVHLGVAAVAKPSFELTLLGDAFPCALLLIAPFFLSVVWFTYLAGFGPALQPHDDPRPNRVMKQSLWTARIAMLAVLTCR
jgi:hypothetical protein